MINIFHKNLGTVSLFSDFDKNMCTSPISKIQKPLKIKICVRLQTHFFEQFFSKFFTNFSKKIGFFQILQFRAEKIKFIFSFLKNIK